MADEVHANTKARGSDPATLECGAPRSGALVTGDSKLVTCSTCKGSTSKSATN